MSLVDKLKNLVGMAEEDDEEMEEELLPTDMERGKPISYDDASVSNSGAVSKKNKVVNIHATTQLQVVLVKPERFEDVSSIADHLNAKRTVVLNLESASREISRRLIDFLSGVTYANNGQIKRVANSTYIITTFNVDIVGDLLDELESSGVFF